MHTRVPLTGSPLRQQRQLLGLTLPEAAQQAGVHTQAWYLAEQGCYSQPPQKILNYLANNSIGNPANNPINTDSLLIDYQDFISNKRLKFKETYAPHQLPEPTLLRDPLSQWLKENNFSRANFAKAIAVQPSHLYRLAKKQRLQLSNQLTEALLGTGWTLEQLDELNERTEEFYYSRLTDG
jgi:transcriptional regulator with XRE-family HTH domain